MRNVQRYCEHSGPIHQETSRATGILRCNLPWLEGTEWRIFRGELSFPWRNGAPQHNCLSILQILFGWLRRKCTVHTFRIRWRDISSAGDLSIVSMAHIPRTTKDRYFVEQENSNKQLWLLLQIKSIVHPGVAQQILALHCGCNNVHGSDRWGFDHLVVLIMK